MPLDTGEVAQGHGLDAREDQLARLRPVAVVLSESGHVGQALKAARESLDLSEEDIGQVTRVRPAYISAIEAFDFGALPARPFIVGYVRSYALALGLDPEAVVARFRAEVPGEDVRLRAPGGVRHDRLAGARILALVGLAVASAVAVWNIARRAELHASSPELAPRSAATPRPAPGPAVIGAPLPTPPEATTPPVYRTPGLAPPDEAATGPVAPAVGSPFVPAGVVYGAPGAGGVVLQALKPTSLVVRGPGGAVVFARLLGAGEAWRSPGAAGLVADVDDPRAVEIYVGGAARGALPSTQTALSQVVDN